MSTATGGKKKAKKNIPVGVAHPGDLQQHDRHDHGSPGNTVAWSSGRARLQGFAQVDPVRGAARRG